jgi:hypothetical protein
MRAWALDVEREEFIGRITYQGGAEFRGYHNGYAPERTMATGMGAVAIRQPRVSDVLAGAEPFASGIVAPLRAALSTNWRAVNGPNRLLLLLAGERFIDDKRRCQLNAEGVAA